MLRNLFGMFWYPRLNNFDVCTIESYAVGRWMTQPWVLSRRMGGFMNCHCCKRLWQRHIVKSVIRAWFLTNWNFEHFKHIRKPCNDEAHGYVDSRTSPRCRCVWLYAYGVGSALLVSMYGQFEGLNWWSEQQSASRFCLGLRRASSFNHLIPEKEP